MQINKDEIEDQKENNRHGSHVTTGYRFFKLTSNSS